MNLSQENSKQLQNGKLEATAEGKLDDFAKNFLLRNKSARWVSVAISVVGIFVSMTMPVRADLEETDCESDDIDDIVIVHDKGRSRTCFEDAGEMSVEIDNAAVLYARDNNGIVNTDKGSFSFFENEVLTNSHA